MLDQAALFDKGVKEFNSKEFFLAHETWEEIWQELRLKQPNHPDFDDLQALIQISVALHLLTQDRLVGAKKVLERARLNIEKSNGVINGANIKSLYQEIIRFLDDSDFENCLNVKI